MYEGRLLQSLLLGIAALLVLAGFEGSSAAERPMILRSLDGNWEGDGIVLKVDLERAQVRIHPDLPFEWHRLVVQWINGREVLFAVGDQLYSASVDPDALYLTSTAFPGRKVLRRSE